MNDMPTITCPKCGYEFEDFDGFGFIYCDKCQHCTHPNSMDGVCGICGRKINELNNRLRDIAIKYAGTQQLRERLGTVLGDYIKPCQPDAELVASKPEKEEFHQNKCNSCGNPMSNDCPACQRLWES